MHIHSTVVHNEVAHFDRDQCVLNLYKSEVLSKQNVQRKTWCCALCKVYSIRENLCNKTFSFQCQHFKRKFQVNILEIISANLYDLMLRTTANVY
jgi:hypothetical protein